MSELTAFAELNNKIVVNGKVEKAKTTTTFAVVNPATLRTLGTLPLCAQADVNQAVEAAKQAQKSWKKVAPQERGKALRHALPSIAEHKEELATLMATETGKALRTECRVEIDVFIDTLQFFAGLGLELKGETIPFNSGMLTYTLREPLGVVAAIVPWNVPLMLMAMKVAPALIAGNSVVLKPSPEASFTVLRAVELMNKFLPPGVLNVVTGDGETTGNLLVQHPAIDKVAFTGSVESGRKVYKNAAEKLIPVTLELGGKSPLIICADADIDKAAGSAVEGMRFTRQGQSCTAASRIFVHASIHDQFVTALLEKLNKLVIGDPLHEKTDIGTLISRRQYDKVQHFLKIAADDPTLTVMHACQLPNTPELQKGLFIRPAVITGITNDHELCQKEIFGPVVAIISWRNTNEVIAEANGTEFGLAAGVWTQQVGTALSLAHQLDAGFVQVNQYIVFRPGIPFGGFKHSGIGKEASLESMLENYTKLKTIMVNLS